MWPVGCLVVFFIFSLKSKAFVSISLFSLSSSSTPLNSSPSKFIFSFNFHSDSLYKVKHTISPFIALFKFASPSIIISLSNNVLFTIAVLYIPGWKYIFPWNIFACLILLFISPSVKCSVKTKLFSFSISILLLSLFVIFAT